MTLLLGDCVERMRELEPGSVDAVVTDPPYGLGFMGREWDSAAALASRPVSADEIDARFRNVFPSTGKGPNAVAFDGRAFQAWCETWAAECLRVLKPGGHLLAFGGARTYHRLTCGLEDAGFEIRDCLVWLYGSGFPKSLNLNGDRQGWGTALKPAHEPIVLARKPLAGTVAANVLAFGTGSMNIDGCRIQTGTDGERGQGGVGETDARGCPVHGLHGLRNNDAEVAIERRESEVAGHLQSGLPGKADDGTWKPPLQGNLDRPSDGLSVRPAGPARRRDETTHSVGEARGAGAPGSGGEDAGPLADPTRARPPHQRRQDRQPTGEPDADGLVGTLAGAPEGLAANGDPLGGEPGATRCTCSEVTTLGRWPANVLLDEHAAEQLDAQTGELASGSRKAGDYGRLGGHGRYSEWGAGPMPEVNGDSGGASRFFYVAKCSRSERNAGLESSCVCGTVKPWDEPKDPEASPLRDISARTEEEGSDYSMSGNGSRPTGLSPTDSKSTTATGSRPTTASRTSNSSPPPSTSAPILLTTGELPKDGSGGVASANSGSLPPTSTGTRLGKDGFSTDAAARAISAGSSETSNADVCPDCGGVSKGAFRNTHPT